MNYRIAWTGPAQRDMARLPARAASAVMVYIDERLAADPYQRTKPLGGELAAARSARNGDYRILCRVDDPQQIVWILHVDHRAHAYRAR